MTRLCPYCRGDVALFEDPPGDIHIACRECGRGPKEPFEEEDIANGRVLEAWDKWCIRKKKAMRRRGE